MKDRELPIAAIDRPMPSETLSSGTVEYVTDYCLSSDTDIQCFHILDNKAVYDVEASLIRAKYLATMEIRSIASRLQEPLDTKVFALEKTLKLDRSNTEAIEKYYQTFQRQQQIRNSSNDAQNAISGSVSVNDVWRIVDSFDSFSGEKPDIAPEVTRAAFLNRLSLSLEEKVDPVFQILTTDLLSAGYIDLRQVVSKLSPLVAYGKLTQERVDTICNSPVGWGERPIHGV